MQTSNLNGKVCSVDGGLSVGFYFVVFFMYMCMLEVGMQFWFSPPASWGRTAVLIPIGLWESGRTAHSNPVAERLCLHGDKP